METAGELHALGVGLLGAGRVREAAFQFAKALGMAPDHCDASICLGHCLHLLGRFEEALAVYDKMLERSPAIAVVWNNRGNTLLEMRRYAEAAESYSRALELAPDLHDARVAQGTCYQSLGLPADAMAACDAVLAAAPDHAEAHWNRALLLLLKGDYREGWREYEWRWQKRGFTSPRRDFPQPRWQGEPVGGRTVLIHAEQGFGDTLQFCRYIPLVAALGARVVFECHPPLVTLMQGLSGNVEVVALGQPLPSFDLHLPLLSLPVIFDTTVETIPNAVPYLSAPPERLPFWRGLAADEGRLRVGLCWAGKSYPDPGRSCPAELLAPLAEVAGVSWYSLQMGWEGALPLPLTDLTGHIRDFGDTAALIAQLDLVITVDTAVAHLAGAMGKPTLVMLPHAPDWRWLLERGDTPWYPTLRLIRQAEPGAWRDVVRRVSDVLRHEAAGFSG
ncbi:MAG: glycosyltransferase family protein [Deltaproteobacteria bacterium]|nr:glycosyltransferase family protein [Deltaproteobacteria bacterium]